MSRRPVFHWGSYASGPDVGYTHYFLRSLFLMAKNANAMDGTIMAGRANSGTMNDLEASK